MYDYGTEAEHLAEIYDDVSAFGDSRYTEFEKRMYVKAKSQCFNETDIGKFVVEQKPRKNKGVVSVLYLVDRKKTKRFWWSHDSWYAMVFEKESAAQIQASKYRFNKVKVKQITSAMANRKYFEQEYE